MVPENLMGGPWQWVIILLIALLLFGGTKLAGLGKATGRAIREFKEETRDLNSDKRPELTGESELDRLEREAAEAERKAAEARAAAQARRNSEHVVDAEIVEQPKQ